MKTIKQNLKDYIDNGKQRLEGLQEEINKLAIQERYEEAERIKYVKSEVSNTLYRLERISKGLPAFEEPINQMSAD